MKRTITVSLVGVLCLGIGITSWFVFSPNKRVDTNSAPVSLETNTSDQSNSLSAGASPVLGKTIPSLPEYCADKLISVSGCDDMTKITTDQGNTYQLVEIGDHCWFADNLKEIPSTDQGWYGCYDDAEEEHASGEGMLDLLP